MYTGLKISGSYRQMRIAFGVNVNHLGQLICNIFGSLQINLGQLQITFANGFTKRFLESFYAIWSNSANKLRITAN